MAPAPVFGASIMAGGLLLSARDQGHDRSRSRPFRLTGCTRVDI